MEVIARALPTSHGAMRSTLAAQLAARNQTQTAAFRDLIHFHTELVKQNSEQSKRCAALEADVAALRDDKARLEKDNKDLAESLQSGAASGPKIAQLEQKLLSVQEELTNSYKVKMEDAQAVLALNAEVKAMQTKMQERDAAVLEAEEKLKKTLVMHDDLEQKLAQRDVTIQVLNDELQALQLELVRTEEKAKLLDNENRSLLQRYLALKEREAEFLNATNLRAIEDLESRRRGSSAANSKDLSGIEVTDTTAAADLLPTKPKKKISAHDSEVTTAAYSKNGASLATGSNDNSVKLWDSQSGSCTATLHGCLQSVMCVEYSDNGELVLGSSNENAIRLWNAQLGRLKVTLTGHTGKVFVARFQPNNARVLSGSHDRSLKMWDLNKGYCVKTIFCFSSCNDLHMPPDGRLISSGHFDNHIRMWDQRSGDIVHEISDVHSGQITSVRLSQDGSQLLSNSRDNTLKLFDTRTWQTLRTFSHEGYRNGMNWNRACFSADGGFVAAGSADGNVYLWNAATGKHESTLKNGHRAPISSVVWHPTGGQMASVDVDKTLVLWE